MKTTIDLLSLLCILFVGFSLLLYFFQGRMIFYRQPTAPENRDRYAAHTITIRRGEVTLSGWLFRDDIDSGRPLIVYYGGNAEDVSLNLADRKRLHGGSFLFMNYRGYGESGGRPSERALCEDAVFILDHIMEHLGLDPRQVVLVGRSLGSGVAVYVAARRKVGGVILVTPFDSLVNVARVHYPFFPVSLLLKHRFDSASLAEDIATPALFLTATADRVVPVRLAKRLEKRWGGPVTAVSVPGADHQTIVSAPIYWDAVNAFLNGVGRPLREATREN